MKCSDWMEKLEKLAPKSLACEWDNPGLLAGRAEKEVEKVLIALDATDDVVDLAVKEQVDLLITHHPLIFHSMKKVNDQDFIGRRLIKLIQADISMYAMHTNFDIAPGCMADLAAEKLGLVECGPLETMKVTDEGAVGIGKTGKLKKPMTLKALAELVKEQFGLPYVTVYGQEAAPGLVERISVCPGSGRGMEIEAEKAGAQVLITGDMGHHEGIDAAANGLVVIDAGHYGLEHIFIAFMAEYCKNQIDGDAQIIQMPLRFPVQVW